MAENFREKKAPPDHSQKTSGAMGRNATDGTNVAPTPPPSDFTSRQAVLVSAIGLPPHKILAWRKANLTEGQDWKKTPEGVFWTAAAATRLCNALELRATDLPPDLPKPPLGEASAQSGLVTFQVLKAWRHTKNDAVLMAWTVKGDNWQQEQPKSAADLFRVKIPRGKLFRRGQDVPARHVQADLWEFVKGGGK